MPGMQEAVVRWRAVAFALLSAIGAQGCARAPAATTSISASGGLVTVTGRLGKASPFLIRNAEVRVRVDGQVRSSAQAGCSSSTGAALQCPVGAGLTLGLRSTEEAGALLLTAFVSGTGAHRVDGFELLATRSGDATLAPSGNPPALQYLHNGYQSWSFSGALVVPDGVPLSRTGDLIDDTAPDSEVVSEKLGLSSHSAVIDGGDGTAMVLGFVTTNLWQGAIGLESEGSRVYRLTAFSGFTGDSVALAGEVDSETLFVKYAASPSDAMAAYGEAIQGRQGQRMAGSVPMNGWFSWNRFFAGIDQPTVLSQSQALAGLTGSSGFNLVEVDDGWEQAWGAWQPNSKFGSIAALAATIHAQGQRLGLWVAPWAVETSEPVVAAHPDWWLRTPDGMPFIYAPPLSSHQLRVVDLTNPEALAWAVGNLTALENAGVDFFKLDYLYLGARDGTRMDSSVTGVTALARGLQAVFAGLQHASVNLCGVPWLHGVLAPPSTMRVGTDVSLSGVPYGFVLVGTAARDLQARAFGPLARRADPDQLLLAPLTDDEAQTALILQAMAGETFALSDDLPNLTTSRRTAVSRAIGLGISRQAAGSDIEPRGVFDQAGTELLSTALAELLENPSQIQSRLPSVIVRGGFLAATNWGDSEASVDLHLNPGEQVSSLWGISASKGHVSLASHASALFRLKP
jgi:hypothetical protein